MKVPLQEGFEGWMVREGFADALAESARPGVAPASEAQFLDTYEAHEADGTHGEIPFRLNKKAARLGGFFGQPA